MEGNSLDLPGSEFSMHWKYSTDIMPVNSRWGRMIGPRFSWDRMLVYTWVGQIIVDTAIRLSFTLTRWVLSSMMRGPLQKGLFIHHLENEEEWDRLICLWTDSW